MKASGLIRLAVVVLVLWAVAWLFFKTLGFVVHLLLIVGLVMLVMAIVRRGAGRIRRPR